MIGDKIKWVQMMTVFTVCLIWMSSTVFAEESVSLKVSSTDIQPGMSTEITITVYDGLKVEKMAMTDYDAFEVLDQRTSSSTQYINGKKSQMKQYTLTAVPKKEGTFNLQVTVNDGKKDYVSETVTVTVSPKDASLGEKAEDVFITTDIARERSYLGESIVLTYNLYTSYNVEGFEFSEPFSLDDAVVEEVPKESLDSNYLTIGDTKYIKYEAKKVVIHPIHPGVFEIPGYEFRVYLSTGDVFGSYKTRVLESEGASVEVMPLPKEGQPENYSGLVGQFKVVADYDKDTATLGEPITLSVSIKGEGNLEVLDTLYKDEPKGLKLYETVGEVSSDIQGEQLISERNYETIWIPQVSGQVEVPELAIPYFDTEKKAYDVLTVHGNQLQVSGEQQSFTEASANNGKGGNLTVKQVTYPKEHPDDFIIYLNKGKVGAATAALAVLMISAFFVGWYRNNHHSDAVFRSVKKKLQKASTPNEQYDLFAEAVFDLTGCHLKTVSEHDLQQVFADEVLLKEIQSVIRYFEYKRFYEPMPLGTVKKWLLDVLKKANAI